MDWKIGTHDAWHEAVARRASQIAADVGAASPRGPLKQNEVGHIVKSVARWVWQRYVAGVPPRLREAQIAALTSTSPLPLSIGTVSCVISPSHCRCSPS